MESFIYNSYQLTRPFNKITVQIGKHSETPGIYTNYHYLHDQLIYLLGYNVISNSIEQLIPMLRCICKNITRKGG